MKSFFAELPERIRTFRLGWQPSVYTVLILLVATAVSLALDEFFIQNNNVSIIYTLSVVAVACVTPGYFYGVVAAVISVIGVNYFFTAPYWALDFSQTGYPITFIILLVASVITSTLVTGYRERDRIRLEAESEKLRSNLLRAVSHDLRTPLTSISGASTALLEEENALDEPTRRALLEDIRENAQWLVRMVENLLSVTRIQSGCSPIKKTPEMAEEIVAQAVAQLRRRFPEQTLTIAVPSEALEAPMDGTLIEQVLINLMENAVYHAGADAPIDVRLERTGAWAVFSVRDHGVGVDEAYIQRLLAGHIDQQRVGDHTRGMGIGLSVCAAILQAHGGTLIGRNAPDGGAVFSFRIPLFDPAA